MDVRQTAWEAVCLGFSVVPPREDGTKAPLGAWKAFQSRLPSGDELDAWYGRDTGGPPKRSGAGLVCGKVSGDLEAFEFDRSGACYEPFKARARALGLGGLGERLDRGYLERTPSGGYHWIYRCPGAIQGNQALASYLSDEVNPKTGKRLPKPIIETRGEGGYIVIAPTNGRVHPTGGAYVLLAGGLESVPVIKPDERAALFEVAGTFDELPPPKPKARPTPRTEGGVTPWDDFNAKTPWENLLVGWTKVFEQDGVTYWRRPGKERGVSATTGRDAAHDRLWCWSTSTDFKAGLVGDKADAYAALHCGGDFKEAVAELRKAGFGTAGDSAVSAVSAARPWGTLKVGKLPEDPGPPLEVLPPDLRELCRQLAAANAVDPGVPLMMILGAAAGLIGNGLAVRMTPTWKEVASLYIALIMPAGGGKSPVQQLLMGPVRDVEEAMYGRWKRAKEAAEADYQALAEAARKQKLPAPKRPRPTPQERLLGDDTTIEALARLFADNPHGLFLIHDELCELFQGLDQYKKGGKGNSQAKLNKIHSHQSFTVDRTEDQKEGKEPIRVKNPTLSIFGNLTPANVFLLGEHDQDGTLERWLPACPDRRPAIPILDRPPLDLNLLGAWRNAVERLVEMSFPDKDVIPQPGDSAVSAVSAARPMGYPTKEFPLGAAAREAWRPRDADHCKEMNDPNFPAALLGTWKKMDMQALRLTITLAGLWAACSDLPMPDEIGPDMVRYAWMLIDYLKVHHHRTFALGRCLMPHGARLICNWIKAHRDKTTFTWRDITQVYPPSRYGEDLERGKDWLLLNNAIREAAQEKQEKPRPGRPPSPRYEVHPDLLRSLESAAETAETAESPGQDF